MSNISIVFVVLAVLGGVYIAALLSRFGEARAIPRRNRLSWQLRMAELRRAGYVPPKK